MKVMEEKCGEGSWRRLLEEDGGGERKRSEDGSRGRRRRKQVDGEKAKSIRDMDMLVSAM
jgi:hypothetical protein